MKTPPDSCPLPRGRDVAWLRTRLGTVARDAARIVACLVLLASPLARAADDWTQQGQDAGAASDNIGQTALDAGNLTALVKLWTRDLDVWQQSTGLAVADGQLFVGRKIAVTQSTVQQQLLRLDLRTGATAWKLDALQSFENPLLTADLVIVAGDAFGLPARPTRVAAFDRATGQPRWLYIHPTSVPFTAPHLSNGVVYLVGTQGDVVALDAATGEIRWRRPHDADCCSANGLAVAAGVVLIGHAQGLLALDAADGHPLWQYELPAFHIASVRPMIVGDTAVLFDLDGTLHALALASGAVRWTTVTRGGSIARSSGPLASDGQRLFALNGVSRPWLSAIDLATGATLWTSLQHVATHSPVVSNGVLYLATNRRLQARDPATGALLPIASLPATRWGELVVAEGKVLISGGPVGAVGLPAVADRRPADRRLTEGR